MFNPVFVKLTGNNNNQKIISRGAFSYQLLVLEVLEVELISTEMIFLIFHTLDFPS